VQLDDVAQDLCQVLYTEEDIQRRIAEIADQIDQDYAEIGRAHV
jgi:hypoxanthine-guanine phosphoribosyltransferase